ncbi:50S ribosomal protein L21 [Candidatus Synchoanobacter obligatus]|uniref:Large ribosomal subunit protein bL21 n=1 Tax=Candidatus Synchoanobacter obligatus TaxID=2919597 RepID=A0ABT1L5E6_9GAMM|nr:50S ribosomal protein L21 [Candidatus Synchoanobacter obligatus]MCP8352402.1 50S ribosomal protein L21 [Candidatus Synchoanobacter obligatus]
MLAVIMTGGKQYKVKPDQVIEIDRLKVAEGDSIEFDHVLLVQDGDKTLVGEAVAKARVKATVVMHTRGAKINVIKFKRRKRYMRNLGHKQQYTKVKIVEVLAQPAKKKAASKPKAKSGE